MNNVAPHPWRRGLVRITSPVNVKVERGSKVSGGRHYAIAASDTASSHSAGHRRAQDPI